MKHQTTLFLFLLLLATFTSYSQTIWNGPTITFNKPNGADWNLAQNQDRITDNVWLTRKFNMSIFNIQQESGSGFGATNTSPTDTEWALGSLSDGIGNLTFATLSTTLNNQLGNNIVNNPMVLHLITDDIYIDINFTFWAVNNVGGGFTYTRSTEATLDIEENKNFQIDLKSNPVKDFLEISNLTKTSDFQIFNINGQLLKKGIVNRDDKIDVSNLTTGIYFVRINSVNLKIIKQ
ncbi:T9SS type A sorting domain-containing protein [Winogradskyella sp.]|uniref:T9SS type A sorting domain-containing protein n=1 Tax=Winogradskyella sp. TaxID=1883156 RepID=UPI002637D001|nr:T9SS type A sorting domain-containing protein [Winogradskyella sp.]